MLDLESITLLFDEKLMPLKDDIKELKEDQKQVVELLLTQTRQDEKINRINEHLQECVEWRKTTEIKIDERFKKINEEKLEDVKKKENALWYIIKILLYVLAGGTIGSAVSKLLF